MGKKKNQNHDHSEEVEKEVQKKEAADGGGKKKEGKNPSPVVLKVEMYCDGCASKLVKLARGFEGVESVNAEMESNKLTVTGKVDPSQIRDFLHQKTKKQVDLISPQPKKEDSKNNKNDTKKPNDNKKSDAADDKKKPKEAPVTTAVIKLSFHCSGCIGKINKIVSKTKGVQEMTLDKQKETVTVKGSMDVKALTETLKERLKKPVEIVPPKKEKDAVKEGENAGGGGGGGKKKKKGNGGGEGQDNASAGDGGDVAVPLPVPVTVPVPKAEGNRMEYMMQPGYGFGPPPGYGYMCQPVPAYGNGYMGPPVSMYGNGHMGMAPPVPVYDYGYGQGQVPGYPVHMKFNDENPNACSIM